MNDKNQAVESTATTIVIVDDDPAHLLLICRAARAGAPQAELRTAGSVSQGIAALNQGGVTLLIVDLKLAHESGLTLLEHSLNNVRPTPKTLVVTTSELESDRLCALEAGATEFLPKGSQFSQKLEVVIKGMLSK